jgi:hypothetical protein
MSGPLNTGALIHDLALILRCTLAAGGGDSTPGHLAARRVQDVLGIPENASTAVTEGLLLAHLGHAGSTR